MGRMDRIGQPLILSILPIPVNYSYLQTSRHRQKTNFTASWSWRGSPTPWRRKPSKLKSADPMVGSMLLFVLKVLNISTIGIIAIDSLKWKARCNRQSKEKNSLFFRTVLRGKQREAQLIDLGCAECACTRAFKSKCQGSSTFE